MKTKLLLQIFLCYLLVALSAGAEDTGFKEPTEVLTLSSAIVDHYIFVSDEELKSFAKEKGSWQPIDYKTLQKYLVLAGSGNRMNPGGSGVNVIKGLQHLGHNTAVIGKVGSDEIGEFFIQKMMEKGIVSFLQKENLPTGQAICFITPDGQRTFCSYLGASCSLSGLTVQPEIFERIKLFHVEGYQLVDAGPVLKAMEMAKGKGVKISLDLANTEIVRRHKELINTVLNKYVDILFCNQDEAKELTGLDAKGACSEIAKATEIAVVTMGDKGCWTKSKETQFLTPSFSIKPVDTTGAGDYFASGFLHGILIGAPLQTCALQGSLVASRIVKEVGTELQPVAWRQIHLKLQNICFSTQTQVSMH